MYYYTYINATAMKNISNIFASLSDPTRRLILEYLRSQDLTPSELLELIDVTQPTLSHHLDILKRAELIEGRREGQFIRYSLNMTVFEMALQYMASIMKRKR
jgi:DNA-binding transcriptional ArsR family regulator